MPGRECAGVHPEIGCGGAGDFLAGVRRHTNGGLGRRKRAAAHSGRLLARGEVPARAAGSALCGAGHGRGFCMSDSSLLTLFATPKKFEGHIGVIQRNAIASWTRMNPRPEVILFGADEGTAEIAAEYGFRHVPRIKTNEWGTPLVSDLFEQAERLGQTPVLSYVNSDIILFDDFASALRRVAARTAKFLMVGRRTDVDIREPIDFASPWAPEVRERAPTVRQNRSVPGYPRPCAGPPSGTSLSSQQPAAAHWRSRRTE